MILPTIPTDNLYKFMALSGLAVLVLSFVTPEFFKYKLKVEQYQSNTDRKLLNMDIEESSERLEEIEMKISVVKGEKTGVVTAEEVDELLSKAAQANKKNRKLEVKYKEYSRLIDYKIKLYQTIKTYQYFGVIFSSLFTFVGFYLWYVKVQRKLDKQILTNE